MTQFDTKLSAAVAHGGIVEGTMIMTLKGAIAVEFLRDGDRVITRSGACTLRGLSVRTLHETTVVSVKSGALGHNRPESALCLHADQAVVVRDWRAKAVYGSDVAVVPAARLADGDFVRAHKMAEVRLFRLEFDRAEVVIADGVELACAPALIAV